MILETFQFRCSICKELSESQSRELHPEEPMSAPDIPKGWVALVVTALFSQEEEGPVQVDSEDGTVLCPHRLGSLVICPMCQVTEPDIWPALKEVIGGDTPSHLKVV
jgi:hypothetical protein